MKKALKQLLDDLDKVFEEHQEVGDTDVKQRMYDAVHDGFIVPLPGYTLPEEFGMFSEEGEQLVRAALQSFLAHPEVSEAATLLKTPKARLAAFQDNSIKSSGGMYYDEFFGYAKEP